MPMGTIGAYTALGDSISIDDYTGLKGGGAASQFAHLLGVDEFINGTKDGCTTRGVIDRLRDVIPPVDVFTLTVGGNDLLEMDWSIRSASAELATPVLERIDRIATRLTEFDCPVIMNTVYDPTDGDDRVFEQLGFVGEIRLVYNALNCGIRDIAHSNGFLLADLEELFRGHGPASAETWFVLDIEPNLDGATAIAAHWMKLYDEFAGRARRRPTV